MADSAPPGLNEFLAQVPEGTEQQEAAPLSADQLSGYANQTEGLPPGLSEFVAPEMHQEINEAKYGSLSQKALAGLEGVGEGLLGPIAPMIEKKLGIKEEDIRGRAETHTGTHYGAELLGLVGPAAITGGTSAAARFTQAGLIEAAAKKIVPVAGETLASKIGSTAAKVAVENLLLSGSDEVSKMVLNDPHQTAQTALVDMGAATLLGGALGAAGASVSPLWKATFGDSAGKLVADFAGRVNEHIENPDPVSAMTKELSDYYSGMKEWASDVHGAGGLKAEAISKTVPEMNEKITSQISELSTKLDEKLSALEKDPHAPLLKETLDNYKKSVATDSPAEIFNATQDLKKQLQEWSKYDKDFSPLNERKFRNAAKGLASDVRDALEDTKVWGKAADLQANINKALAGSLKGDLEEATAKRVGYITALNDFEKKFTTKIAGEKVIDPTKINTYLNQIGKPNAEIKQEMLKNFLEASDMYKKQINSLHGALGMDSPIVDTPLNVTMNTLGKKTLGSKLADAFLAKGLGEAGAKGTAGAIGATAGTLLGHHGEIGALIGVHALGGFFQSILPAIAKSLVKFGNNSAGFKAAVDYVHAVTKGETLLNKAATNLFKSGSAILPESQLPNERERNKIDKRIQEMMQDPERLMNGSNQILGHYMPDHNEAMAQAAGNIANYLKSLKPGVDRAAPLDSKPVPNSAQEARYRNALNIAQQPLVVLEKIQKGTININDMKDLMSMYPQLYMSLNRKLTEAMTDHISKGETVPYQTRIGLSTFLAQPLDSTMTQPALMSIMQMSAGPMKPAQAPMGRAPAMKGTKSSPALQKMPGMYQTPGQSRMSHKISGK